MQHLAIIPDGNRRWAVEHKLEVCFGHKKGMDAFGTAITVCLNNGIKFLSFYAFSLENFKRSDIEKKYLFSTLPEEFLKKLPDLIEKGVKVQFLGDKTFYPENLKKIIREIEEKTQSLKNLTLSFLFCYGGRQELVFAAKKIAEQIRLGDLRPENITEQVISDSLWTAGMPDPDLIIRTSGIVRLSNFLLYQAAYSEFKFLSCYWPEVSEQVLQECVDEFNSVQRKFGE
jgi:undecaprenyl diphosphate synthase